MPVTIIAPAESASDISDAAHLFRAYAASLPIDLGYQGFEAELAGLPGRYAPPEGALLLARVDGLAAGCVALRKIGAGICEMKRLFVSPSGRGLGVGRALVEAIVTEAQRMGYREMRLDTLPSMRQARHLYDAAGFRRTAPYYDTPVAGTEFLSLSLEPA